MTRTRVRGPARYSGWLLALGLALLAVGVVLFWVARSPSGPGPTTVAPTPYSSFEVEPPVRLGPAPPRRDPAAGVPVRLVVPHLHVTAPVIAVRMEAGGTLWPPNDPTEAGWWAGGAVPGAKYGSALIVGHTVHTGGGVFDDLLRLSTGDRLRVRTDHGVVRYRVTSTSVYRKAALARDAQRVFDQTVPGRLVLVTCTDWNGSIYLSNTVVTASPVSSVS